VNLLVQEDKDDSHADHTTQAKEVDVNEEREDGVDNPPPKLD